MSYHLHQKDWSHAPASTCNTLHWTQHHCRQRETRSSRHSSVLAKFVYISHSINIDEEVAYRLARASTAFGRLKDQVWECRGSRLETKLKVYRAVVLPSLLYACETDCLQPACQTTQRLPHEMSEDPASHQVAGQSARHWSPPSCWVWEHLRHSAALSAPVGRPRSTNGLLYGELRAGQRSLGRPKKRYRLSERISQALWHSLLHMGSEC